MKSNLDSGEGTYLEEFISSVELLPNDFRRDFELMRELDREALELERELRILEQTYLDRARMRKAENKFIAVPVIEPLLDVHASHAANHQIGRKGSIDIAPAISLPGGLSLSSPISEKKSQTETTASALTNTSPGKDKSEKSERHGKGSTEVGTNLATVITDEASKEKDPEGSALLVEIHGLRARIRARLSQKTSNAINLSSVIAKFQSKLNSDLAFFETTLRSCGEFTQVSGAQPGQDVAMRPSASSDEMILGKVIVYYADIGAYDVADVDNSKRYHLHESLVTVLDMVDITNKRLSKGETIYSVYPETTAFYLAQVAQAPRRVAPGVEPTVAVQFQGDSDANGVTPVVIVPLRYCFRAL